MILKQGDLWDELGQADYLLVTANATVKQDGSLVMGRGAALEAKQRFPSLDQELGQQVFAQSGGQVPWLYGLALCRAHTHGATQLGAFQVKHHFREPAELPVIAWSCGLLHGLILKHRANGRKARVAMNFPGIGAGQLPRSLVLPLIRWLPDEVTVYEFPP